MTCSYSYLSHRKTDKVVGEKACVSHVVVAFHRALVIITQAQIIKRAVTDEPDQGRMKNGGGSYGKSCSISVPTVQKRSQGDRKCSEELYKTMQWSGKLDLDHEIKGSWSIGIIQEKSEWLAHALQWNTGETVSDSGHIFNLAKNGRKI